MKPLAMAALAAALLSGCATQAKLTINSQPDGAYITDPRTGKALGVAPVTVYFDAKDVEKYRRANGCYYLGGVVARWVSGVSAGQDHVQFCGKPNGSYTLTFSRPAAGAGLDRDLEFALRLQSTRAQQQAADNASAAALYHAFDPPSRRAVNCISTRVADLVQTSCY